MQAPQVIMALSFRFDCGQSGMKTRIKLEFIIHLQCFKQEVSFVLEPKLTPHHVNSFSVGKN